MRIKVTPTYLGNCEDCWDNTCRTLRNLRGAWCVTNRTQQLDPNDPGAMNKWSTTWKTFYPLQFPLLIVTTLPMPPMRWHYPLTNPMSNPSHVTQGRMQSMWSNLNSVVAKEAVQQVQRNLKYFKYLFNLLRNSKKEKHVFSNNQKMLRLCNHRCS